MTARQAENLLGALSLRINDEMQQAVAAASGQGDNTAIALSALHHCLEGPSIDYLRQVLGLTSSGTVRLVDRLVAAGYVRRGTGEDGRTTIVALTASGRRAAIRVTDSRRGVLSVALGALSDREREQFGRLAGKVLGGLIRGPGATKWTCRLCDTTACGRDEGRCPVATAAGWRPG
jgi:DNA-binding MarR family transcriptional regulator